MGLVSELYSGYLNWLDYVLMSIFDVFLDSWKERRTVSLFPSVVRRTRPTTQIRAHLFVPFFFPLPSVGPATYKSFHGLQAPLPTGAGVSRDEAAKIIQAERDNLDIISEIIAKEGIAETVDFWRGHLCESEYTFHAGEEMWW